MGARVLVVDDSPTIRKLVSAILAHHDYDPVPAGDGQTGLDRLREGGIDLVLLDFVMPRMNGYQFCLELRADEKLCHVPVVLMSAKGDKIRGQFVQQTGAVDAITKPFDARGLIAVVESALQKAASGRLPVARAESVGDESPEDGEPTSEMLSAQARIAASRRSFFDEVVGEMAQTLADALGPALELSLVPGPGGAANGGSHRPRGGWAPGSGTSSEPAVAMGAAANMDGVAGLAGGGAVGTQPTAQLLSSLAGGGSGSLAGAGNADGVAHLGASSSTASSVGRMASAARSAGAWARSSSHRSDGARRFADSSRPEGGAAWSEVTGVTATGAGSGAARALAPSRIPNGQLSVLLRQLLTPEVLQALAPALLRLGLAGEPFGGDTDIIPLAEVMQLLQLQRQTGTCRITNGRVEVTVCFREGLIDLAIGRGAGEEFLLGRYLIAEGVVSRENLDRVLEREGGSQRKIGEKLIKFGIITEQELRRALIRQTSELLYEVLRWPKARFSFVKDTLDQPDVARLGLPVASIVMEGFRRVDEWRLIEETIQFDQVLLRDQVALDALGPGTTLSRHEQQLLEAIDGQRTVREILGKVEIGAFDACKILFQFLQSRLVRQRAA